MITGSGDAPGQRYYLIRAHGIAQPELHPHASRAGGVELLQFVITDLGIDYADGAAILAQLRQHIEHATVVGAVGGRLHHHIAAGAELFLQRPIVADGGIRGLQHRIGIVGKAGVIDVMMAVGGAVRHGESDARVLGQRRGGCQSKARADHAAAIRMLHHFFPI
jgi:hypothetical protein